MSKSAKQYIEQNDFKGAYERFLEAGARWKNHWFTACVEIFNNCKEFAKEFFIDVKEQIIKPITEYVKKSVPKKDGMAYTYIIKMFDDCGNWIFTKIGKTNNMKRRMAELSKEHYKKEDIHIDKIEVIKVYETANDNRAQCLESLFREYFEQFHALIPNDRFNAFEPSAADLAECDRKHALLSAI